MVVKAIDTKVLYDSGFTQAPRASVFNWQLIARTYRETYRVRVHRDSYDNQSYTLAEVWTTAGWAEVWRADAVMVDLPKPSQPFAEDPTRTRLLGALDLAINVVEG